MNRAVSAPFHKGVNFTNWLEYRAAEDIDENLFSKTDFENVKKLGCDVVRLPIHFERMCSAENDYKIPDKIFRILDKVSAWAEELEMYVIFDFHNSTHVDSFTSGDVENVLMPIWSQMASRYRSASKYIVYELMNEPHGIEIPLWNSIIVKVFSKVRSLDPNHYIIVGGADWNSFAAMRQLPDFVDGKVIYTFHFYDPHTFTHQGASWCHMERVVGIPFPYDKDKMPPLPENPTEEEKRKFETYAECGTLEAVVKFFDQYADFSIERNAPVYCGEFGCFSPYADRKERAGWYEIVAGLLEERNIARTSWDYYGTFGMYELKRNSEGRFCKQSEYKFPDDLNMEIVKALGLNCEL